MRKIVCFHHPCEPNGYLSNWYASSFELDNVIFSSVEQYMMFCKAKTFCDSEIGQQIMATDNVGKIKALGRSVKNYDEVIWNGLRQIIVYEGLVAKFKQNTDLSKLLLETEDAVLAECSVQDKVWGIGLSMKDERCFDIHQWLGANLLGFTLMQVRNTLAK